MTFRDQDSRSRLEVQVRGETETRLSKMCLETVSRPETGLENSITNNHVFALLISMSRFNSINVYQKRPKFKLLLQKKYKIFERWGLRPQTPVSAHHHMFLATACLCLRIPSLCFIYFFIAFLFTFS